MTMASGMDFGAEADVDKSCMWLHAALQAERKAVMSELETRHRELLLHLKEKYQSKPWQTVDLCIQTSEKCDQPVDVRMQFSDSIQSREDADDADDDEGNRESRLPTVLKYLRAGSMGMERKSTFGPSRTVHDIVNPRCSTNDDVDHFSVRRTAPPRSFLERIVRSVQFEIISPCSL
jgi:hypothetical protein